MTGIKVHYEPWSPCDNTAQAVLPSGNGLQYPLDRSLGAP